MFLDKPGSGAVLFAAKHKLPAISFHKTNEASPWRCDFLQYYHQASMLYHCIDWRIRMLYQALTGLLHQDLNKRLPSLHRLVNNSARGQLPAENIQWLCMYQPE